MHDGTVYYIELIGQKTVNTAKSSVQVDIFGSFREFSRVLCSLRKRLCKGMFKYVCVYSIL